MHTEAGLETAIAPTGDMAPPALRCFNCSYSLAGLRADGLCPECGFPVARSLLGDELVHSSTEYIKRLHQGLFLILASIVGQIIAVVLIIALGFAKVSGATAIGTGVSLVCTIASAVGWWFFSEADPKLTQFKGETPRKLIRAMVLLSLGLALVNGVWEFIAPQTGGAGAVPASATPMTMLPLLLGLVGLVASGVSYFASMLYVRWMAPRVPNVKVFRRARRMMWLGPLLMTVGVLLMGLGPLIALVLYYNMFDWLRKDFKRIRAEQAAHPVFAG